MEHDYQTDSLLKVSQTEVLTEGHDSNPNLNHSPNPNPGKAVMEMK